MHGQPLEIDVYQIVDDAVMKANRTDGTGWEWCWADWRREWMDATPNRYAYRCLPLTIMNQTGWWVLNPVGFTATWRGRPEPGSLDLRFDAAADLWKGWINDQFGAGIITWNTPFLFRTRPEGSRLLVCGPVNEFRANAHPLTALIESDWISMSFTMNWKLMTPGQPVRFEAGAPLFQVIPLAANTCADLESARVTYRKLSDSPEVQHSYNEWNAGRLQFHDQKARGEVRPDDWQKDYFRGRDMTGREVAPAHSTKVKPPPIQYAGHPPADGVDPLASYRKTYPVRDSPAPVRPAAHEPGHDSPFVSRFDVSPAGMNADMPTFPASGPVFDDHWRLWVAENLLRGVSRESLLPVLAANGFAEPEAVREIDLAGRSPYLRAAERLAQELRARQQS